MTATLLTYFTGADLPSKSMQDETRVIQDFFTVPQTILLENFYADYKPPLAILVFQAKVIIIIHYFARASASGRSITIGLYVCLSHSCT